MRRRAAAAPQNTKQANDSPNTPSRPPRSQQANKRPGTAMATERQKQLTAVASALVAVPLAPWAGLALLGGLWIAKQRRQRSHTVLAPAIPSGELQGHEGADRALKGHGCAMCATGPPNATRAQLQLTRFHPSCLQARPAPTEHARTSLRSRSRPPPAARRAAAAPQAQAHGATRLHARGASATAPRTASPLRGPSRAPPRPATPCRTTA